MLLAQDNGLKKIFIALHAKKKINKKQQAIEI